MFKTKLPRYIMTVGEEFEAGGGNDFSAEEDNSQPTETEQQPNPFNTGNDDSGSGFNPAWSSVLDEIPSEFHNKIAPHLSEWDKNYHSGLEKARQEVQSQYEPFNQFLENDIDPDILSQSYQIYQAIENNPQQVLEALQQAAGVDNSGQGDDDEEYYDPNDISNDPRYQKLEENFQQLSDSIQEREDQKAYEAEQEQLVEQISGQVEGLMNPFKEAYGFDMDAEEVLRIAIQNAEDTNSDEIDIEGAARHFGEMISQYRTPQPQTGFKVMPTSGGIPSTNQDVKNLSDEESKNLMIQMLQQAQGGQ